MPSTSTGALGPTIAIATCPEARPVDEDAPLLLAALAARGATASEQDWTDRDVQWGGFDLVVVRSTWDYASRRDEFVAWSRRVGAVTRLANPAPVITWNTDKHYLLDLASDGVPTVPTSFLDPTPDAERAGAAAWVAATAAPDTGFVVKPAVSAGARDTFRHAAPDIDPSSIDRAAEHAIAILRSGRSAMLQPYLDTVDDEGETGLVFFAGRFSHAFRKGALLRVDAGTVDGLFAPEDITPREPTDEQLVVAAGALDAARRRTGSELLYARVDLLVEPTGRSVVLELELTEPSFFLHTDADAAGRAAAAIVTAATSA